MINYKKFYNQCMEIYRVNGEDAAKAHLATLKKSQLVDLAQAIKFGDCVKMYQNKEEILKTLTIHCLRWDRDREILAEVMEEVRREYREILGY